MRWTEAANATGYHVHMRNVTAGETGFTRLPNPITGKEWTADLLINGATYEYKLQSVSGLIEGATSAAVRVTPTVAPPAGPTNLTSGCQKARRQRCGGPRRRTPPATTSTCGT